MPDRVFLRSTEPGAVELCAIKDVGVGKFHTFQLSRYNAMELASDILSFLRDEFIDERNRVSGHCSCSHPSKNGDGQQSGGEAVANDRQS